MTSSIPASVSERPAATATVRAAVVDGPGMEPRVTSVVLPDRRPRTTSVAVAAAPVNPLDLLIASGGFHSARHEAPYVPGSEFVGVVLESDQYASGTWVYGECFASPVNPGSLAQQTVVPDDSLVVLPEGLDPVQAAAVGNAGVAAYLPLVETAELRKGETVVVLGATGAVGQIAVQAAKRHGARRVVGVARNVAALERLLTLGADAVVELRAGESVADLSSRLLEASGPVDVVLDGVYGRPLEAILPVCAPRARVVNIGNAAGATAELPAGLLRGKQLRLAGFAGLHTPFQSKLPALRWLWSAVADGRLTVETRSYGLEDVPQAWQAQADSPHGKCVVVP